MSFLTHIFDICIYCLYVVFVWKRSKLGAQFGRNCVAMGVILLLSSYTNTGQIVTHDVTFLRHLITFYWINIFKISVLNYMFSMFIIYVELHVSRMLFNFMM